MTKRMAIYRIISCASYRYTAALSSTTVLAAGPAGLWGSSVFIILILPKQPKVKPPLRFLAHNVRKIRYYFGFFYSWNRGGRQLIPAFSQKKTIVNKAKRTIFPWCLNRKLAVCNSLLKCCIKRLWSLRAPFERINRFNGVRAFTWKKLRITKSKETKSWTAILQR